MSPQKVSRKGNRPDLPNKRAKDMNRLPVNSRVANRVSVASTVVKPNATALMPMISTLEFPPLGAQPSHFLRPVKKWCIKQGTPIINPLLRKSYARDSEEAILWQGPIPAYSLKKGNIITINRQSIAIAGDVPGSSWSEIEYEETSYDRVKKQWVKSRITGWVNDAYLDDYHEKFPDFEVKIPHATKNSNDPQQFMTIIDEGYSEFNVRTNMCGELCVAFVVEQDIDTVLKTWNEQGKKGYYRSLVGKGQNKTTTQIHLKDILDLYYTNAEDIRSFRGELLTVPLFAPSTDPNYPRASNEIQERLKTYSLITLVRVDLNTGELKPTERPEQRNHWIVLDKITQDGNRVVIYNPFPNKRQEYSFPEFFKSLGSNPTSGWWVKRNQDPRRFFVQDFQMMKSPLEVKIINANPVYSAAQYIDVEGKKKTNLCGEFCVAFIVQDSIEGVLGTWKKDQKLLYEDIIGNNKTTGTGELITILKSYGYNNKDDFEGFSALLGDPYTKQYLPSPGRIARRLETHYLIAGVNIDGRTGRLKPPPAVPHWVVVDKITPVGRIAGGNGGWVELYNPFSNSREEYSYSEFANSIDPFAKEYGVGWSGLWVKRTIVPKFETPGMVAPSGGLGHVQGSIFERSSRPGRWTEGQLLTAIRLQSKAGKPINKIAADLLEKSGWKREDILSLFKKSTVAVATVVGKWTEAQLRAEMQKRRNAGKPISKIVGELAKISGWKSQDIFDIFKKNFKAGGGEKWTEEQMLSAIQEQFKITKSPNKITAALMEGSGWKNWEISKLLKTMNQTKGTQEENQPRITVKEESTLVVDPQTIVQASKPWADFLKWQDSLLALNPKLYRVLPWGHPTMIKHGFDVNQSTPSNFQAVNLYNDGNKEFGAVSNFIRISHEDVMRLKALQIEDEYEAKKEDWRKQKMNYLCKFRGTVYFFDEESDQWPTASRIRWGTLALGGNLVQVEGTEMIRTKLRDSDIVDVEMARLKGFRASDWGRPLDDLLAEGLVHRCFCAYHHNHFGDSPKGIIYSPFYSPLDWDFSGTAQPTGLYIPMEWLSREASEKLNLDR